MVIDGKNYYFLIDISATPEHWGKIRKKATSENLITVSKLLSTLSLFDGS